MSHKINKIAIVGAGSIVFTKKLIADILSYPSLEGSTICLMDIDSHRLDLIAKLAEKMVAQSGKKFEITSTLDRHVALSDSDYVIITIQVGGLEAYALDVEIPAKYGVEQCIGDTIGAGGVFRALRTIPVLLDIARDMERICPKAYLLDYTNPMAMNIWALSRESRLKIVGLCHSIPNTAERISKFLGANMNELSYLAAGINHMAWFLRFERNGNDAYPQIRERMNDPEIYGMDPVRFDLMRHFGYFVSESSGHASEYYPYFRKRPELIEKFVKNYTTPDAYWHEWGKTGGNLRHARQRREEQDEKLLRQISGEDPIEMNRSNEFAIQIIDSIEGDNPKRVYANVMNHGLITNLPNGCCVEVPCLADKEGVNPCYVGDLPAGPAALCRSAVSLQELTVGAAIKQDKNLIYQAVALDPLAGAVLSLEEVRAMTDEMIDAEKPWLPDFH